MKKRIAIFFAAFSLIIAFSACTSLPKRGSPDDCLIVMKTITVNNTAYPSNMRSYFLKLSAGYGSVKIGKDYTAFIIQKPCVEILSLTTYVSGSATGDHGRCDVLAMLPYNPGHAAVLSTAFEQTISEHGPDGVMSSVRFRELEDSEFKEFIAELRKDPAFSDWEF